KSAPQKTFISVAASHWQIVIWTCAGEMHLTVRGPETKASVTPIPEDAEFLGIQFRLGAFMPGLPVGPLVDGELTLPRGIANSFRLDGSAWEVPSYDNADGFVRRLVGAGLLVSDPVARAAVQGQPTDLSERSVQRRVRQATGLTLTTIRQIE